MKLGNRFNGVSTATNDRYIMSITDKITDEIRDLEDDLERLRKLREQTEIEIMEVEAKLDTIRFGHPRNVPVNGLP